MTYEQKGIYIDLIALCWMDKYIPEDHIELADLLSITKKKLQTVWPKIRKCFKKSRRKGFLINPRVEMERSAKKAYHLNRSKAGKKGAEKRHRKNKLDSSATNLPLAKDSSSSSSSSSSSKTKTKTKTIRKKERKKDDPIPVHPEWFNQFWEAHPKKIGKLEAIKSWNKLDPDEELFREMLERLIAQAKVIEKQFFKGPAAWLNGKRWQDEIIPSGSNGKGPPVWKIEAMQKAIRMSQDTFTGKRSISDEEWDHCLRAFCNDLGIQYTQELYEAATEN